MMDDAEFPVRINLLKFLSEERRKCLIDFSRAKITANPGQELDWKVIDHLI
jgi:hypothetical protein